MSTTSVSLTNAVTSGDERAVSALIANGADVNESTSGGQTALILAVIFGHTNVVKLLVNSGADPQLRDNLGLNAIEWARRRGSREALEILLTTQGPRASSKRVVKEPERPVVEPPPTTQQPDVESKETVSDDERSRRFLAGLRQRLDEQKLRQDLPPAEPVPPPAIEPPAVERRATETTQPSELVESKPVSSIPPVRGRILEPPPEVSPPTGNRKRCPECNEIYNADLVSYCSTHIVPLVDIDAPLVAELEPPKKNPPLFWIMVAITLVGSIVMGSLITAYMFRSNQATARDAVQLPTTQKGFPEVGGDLVGKVVSLPEAECPLNGPEPLTGTVIVHVRVDKNGQVNWARGSGGDWLMRGASTEAAMKSTFAPEKLRGRETEGTITYTFRWPY